MSLGATRRLLTERFGLSLPRRALRRIFESTSGNPLFALEVGRMLVERGSLAIGEEIPVPETLEELLGKRVAHLSAPVRRVLLTAALSADLRMPQLSLLADSAAIEDAVDFGVGGGLAPLRIDLRFYATSGLSGMAHQATNDDSSRTRRQRRVTRMLDVMRRICPRARRLVLKDTNGA